ncbi:MarC family protein [Desulfogranum marinum]|uniref:MarC family protein n=1 Tax=Desulfogranum marinum TaxID=453220 RepID=UPI001962EBE0|nr:MarC family protein [Desulfogranum marinum]MBM9514032.1 MarC family protein [Desulfogranum marinum]
MVINWDLISNFAIAMLAIVNPMEKIPLWVAASSGERRSFRWLLAGLVIVTCASILLFFLCFGQFLLLKLKIDLASFKIGGGLILLQFGFSVLKGTAVEFDDVDRNESTTTLSRVLQRYQQIFIPIGVPVIAGPGAITTVIIYGHESDSLLTTIFLSVTLVAVLLILLMALLSGSIIQKVTGTLPLELASRVFGMILIAIAVQFMVEGLVITFPGWAAIH